MTKSTIKDVAKVAGVSVATVSMALNNRAGVNAETRMRVLRVARSMNYVPSYSAQSLVTQESNCVGLLIPEIQNPFYDAIVDIMSHLAEKHGFTLLLGITNNSVEQEEKYIRFFLSHRVQGVIAIPVLNKAGSGRTLDVLRAANVPIVFCTERYCDSTEPVVMCDFVQGQYEITKYLIDRGLRDFWYVTVDTQAQYATLRYEGYVRALREAGLPVRPEREMRVEVPKYEHVYRQVERFLEDRPEAIICINDIMTMAIIKRLHEKGLRIPEDISVVGFDDIMFSSLVYPPLTTVHQPIEEICERTIALLLDLIAEKPVAGDAPEGGVHLIAPHLVIRETTI